MMRGESVYIWQLARWPEFRFDTANTGRALAELHESRGRALATIESLGMRADPHRLGTLGGLLPVSLEGLQALTLDTLTQDAVRSSAIEGETLDEAMVRSSFARRLGVDLGRPKPASRKVDGLVELLLDALWRCDEPLTESRVFHWHSLLFPESGRGNGKLEVGCWRTSASGPMRVVSGPYGRSRVHFEAPPARRVAGEMQEFLEWFAGSAPLDPVVRSAIAHLWFVTVHPLADGNGRIARAIGDLVLARADAHPCRFYSVSAQIAAERSDYYDMLERTQKGTLDISGWVAWYIGCVSRAIRRGVVAARGVAARESFWSHCAGVPLNERQTRVLRRFLADFEGHLTASKWAKLAKCSEDTALRDVTDLIAKGILRRSQAGGRSTRYELCWEPAHAPDDKRSKA